MIQIILNLFCYQKSLPIYHLRLKYKLMLNVNPYIVQEKSEFETKLTFFILFCIMR